MKFTLLLILLLGLAGCASQTGPFVQTTGQPATKGKRAEIIPDIGYLELDQHESLLSEIVKFIEKRGITVVKDPLAKVDLILEISGTSNLPTAPNNSPADQPPAKILGKFAGFTVSMEPRKDAREEVLFRESLEQMSRKSENVLPVGKRTNNSGDPLLAGLVISAYAMDTYILQDDAERKPLWQITIVTRRKEEETVGVSLSAAMQKLNQQTNVP